MNTFKCSNYIVGSDNEENITFFMININKQYNYKLLHYLV